MERPNPPQTVFSLPVQQTFQQRQTSRFPDPKTSRFPEPQFGGFRPVKRHLSPDTLQERIDDEGERSRVDRSKYRKFQRNQSAPRALHHAASGKSASRGSAHQRAKTADAPPRKAQEKLGKEVTKVFFEEYSELDNELDPDYYYYYEYLD